MTLKLLKKKLTIKLALLAILALTAPVAAQTTISLPEVNIVTGANYTVNALTGPSLTGVAGLLPTFYVSSAGTGYSQIESLPGIPNIPLTNTFVNIISVGNITLLGSGTEVSPVYNTATTVYSGLISLLPGLIKFSYKIVPAGFAWRAGTFSNTLIYSVTGLLTGISSPNQLIRIIVPPFITKETAQADITINVTTFAQFRTLGVTATGNLNYYTTVPTDIRLKSTAENFSFNKTYPNLPVPVNSSALLSVKLPAYNPVNPTITDQNLATNLTIPAGNKVTNQPLYTLTAANLKSKFIQAGTYTLPITYSIPPVTSGQATTATLNGTVTVNVANITALTVLQPAVNLKFSTTDDYKNGVSVTLNNHLNLSSTIPYDVTVKASAANFSSAGGGTLPVNLVRIEGASGQAGVLPITLSTTAQKIINASVPVVDRQLSLKYTILPAQTTQLLNKTTGDYTTTITYTLVAP